MSNDAGRVPVIACVREAWGFLRDNWRLLTPAAAAAAAIAEIGPAAVLLFSPAGSAAGPSGLGLVVLIPAILASAMFNATVLRKAVREEFKAPIGLDLSSDEWRLLGVATSIMLLAIPIFLLISVLLTFTALRSGAGSPEAIEALAANPGALAEAMIQAMGPFGSLVLLLAMVGAAAIVIGLVALANAATLGERRIVIFQAWSWMSGNTLRVFAAILLTVIPTLLATALIGQVVTAVLVSTSGETVGVVPYLLSTTIMNFAGFLLGIPSAALGAVLYRGLRPANFVSK